VIVDAQNDYRHRIGSVTVTTRRDVCGYLEYFVDLVAGKHNRYHCNLEGSHHTCKHWGWCPMYDKSEKDGTKLEMEYWDLR
jgi:hypothetical protein